MKKTLMTAAALCVAILMIFSLNMTVHAGGGPEADGTPDPASEDTAREEPSSYTPVENPFTQTENKFTQAENPFTPAGTGTVVDNATDEEGKEFYTIKTADENIFYLVIDRQRDGENVYFLNAVTEQDLFALAEQPKEAEEAGSSIPDILPDLAPEETSAPVPETEQEKGGNPGMAVLLILILIGCGGAGWYLKIYLPRQQAAVSTEPEEEYEEDYYDADTEDTGNVDDTGGMEFLDIDEDDESGLGGGL